MDEGGFWVFGYGSLMWRPGFDAAERRIARLHGWRRGFCLRSVMYRGTPAAPGLVLGLEPISGGWCDGVAFRVDAAAAEATLAYLRARELVTYAYREIRAPVAFAGGGEARALAYAVDPDHAQYAGTLPLAEQAAIIARAEGPAGTNRAYLADTLAHLAECGVRDPDLEALGAAVAAVRGAPHEHFE
jgi:cation transport protein ChaC